MRRRALAAVCVVGTLFFAATASGTGSEFALTATSVEVTPVQVTVGETAFVTGEFDATCAASGCAVESIEIRIAWRKLDRQSICGFAVVSVPLEDGPHTFPPVGLDTSQLIPGVYEVSLTLDPEGIAPDEDRSDNIVRGTLEIVDSLPEIHPLRLEMTPASPIVWGETTVIRTDVENTGVRPAGRCIVRFSARVASIQPVASSASELAACRTGLLAAAGVESSDFATVSIPGLAVGESVTIEQPLNPEELIRTLVGESDICADEYAHLKMRVRFLLSIEVELEGAADAPLPAEIDTRNDTINAFMTVSPSGLLWPELQPVRLELNQPTPIPYDYSLTALAEFRNVGGSAAHFGDDDESESSEPRPAVFHLRRSGDVDWGPELTPDSSSSIETLGIEGDGNRATVRLSLPPTDGDWLAENADILTSGVNGRNRLKPGEYELRVVIDPDDRVPEQNENNNQLVVGFSVSGPQLRPLSLQVAETHVYQGDRVSVSSEITNTGTYYVDSFPVGFFIDDQRVGTYVFHSMGEPFGEDSVVRVQSQLDTRDFPPGVYHLRVVVDPENWWPERDEADNEISTEFEILEPEERKAELHPVAIEILRPSEVPHANYEIVAEIRNSGDLSASAFPVCFRLSAGAGCEAAASPLVGPVIRQVDQLDPGGSVTLRVQVSPFELVSGPDYCVHIAVDDAGENQGVIAEQDEENNTMTMGFSVSGDAQGPRDPNLTCVDIQLLPSSTIEPGVTVRLTGAVANSGGTEADVSVVEFHWTDSLGNVYRLGQQAIPQLDPGEREHFSLSVDTSSFPIGLNRVTVLVDAGSNVAEANEDDNQCHTLVQIGPRDSDCLADLVPIGVRFDSPGASLGEGNTVEQNQPLYVYVTVRNDGCIPSGPFAVAFETALGVDTEEWTGVGAQDQVEVSYPVPTSTAGDFTLLIEVDPDNRVYEGPPQSSAEENNRIPNQHVTDVPEFSVAAVSPPQPRRIVPPDPDGATVGWSDSPARWLAAEADSSHVYVVWEDGDIGRVRVEDDTVSRVAELAVTVADVEFAFGSTPCAYIAGTDGSLRRVNLDTGAAEGETSVDDEILAIAIGDGGRVYAAVGNGFYQLTPSGSSFTVSRHVSVPSEVVDIQYDGLRQLIYVLSRVGVHAYGTDLGARCSFEGDAVGTPAEFALGGFGNYLATTAGSGGILYALSHCTSTGDGSGQILAGWRYPRSGALAGEITSIVIDPRDIDPIYVATSAGALYSLGFDGTPRWIHETVGGIHSTPLADRRTGRVFFGDDAGIPYVLTLDGVSAFEIDLTGYSGGAIRSSLVMVETRDRTDFGTRLVRNYYYGTEDGEVYTIASRQ